MMRGYQSAAASHSRHALRINATVALIAVAHLAFIASCSRTPSAEERVIDLLNENAPYHLVSPKLFAELGWSLPDNGATVKALADNAPGGAFDPRHLETFDPATLGYSARWHERRFQVYGVDWDIGALHLVPESPSGNLPTMVIINGGAANWYEFFIDPKNRAGLGQYLAQKVPVLLVTIPGNYRHGGWSEMDFGNRIPAYLLDRDVSQAEAKLRNAAYTFRVVSDGVRAIVEDVVDGGAVLIGHSTGGEVQFILRDALLDRTNGLSMGWGTGGPAGMQAMRSFRGERSIDDFEHVSEVRARTPDQYAGGYLGPLNPYWDDKLSRQQIAEDWMGAEARRRPQFKQPLQDMEHSSTINLLPEISAQIRQTLAGNELGIDAEEVIADLFTTMQSPVDGYRRMIWTSGKLDTGHWNEDPAKAREVLIAAEFRAANPGAPIRVLAFDVPLTHYGHIEKPKELAGGLVAALRWLAD